MQVLKAGVMYFALVFGAGFILGPIRILWAVPRFGVRVAELIEMPIMLMVILAAARWVVRRFALPCTLSSRVGMGCLALALLLAAEFGLVLPLRDMSLSDYFSTVDPVSGTVYFLLQGFLAFAPVVVARR
jgi:hypothetical protein